MCSQAERSFRRWLGRVVVVGALALTTSAHAQEQGDTEMARELLAGQSADEVRMGLEALILLPPREAIELLSERIRAGLPAELLDQAVDTFSLIADPSAGPVLAELTRHRRPEVRARAADALVTSRARDAGEILITLLGDPAPEVRAAAARALGEVGHHDAVDALFQAFDRGVPEAASALGRLIRGREIDRFLAYLGQRPLPPLLEAMSLLLDRDDLPERVKVEAIAQLGELATAEVRVYLEELADVLPAGALRTTARNIAGRIAE